MFKQLLTGMLFFAALSANAADTNSIAPVKIIAVNFYSAEESIYPAWKGIVQVQLDNLSWKNASSCNTKYIAIRGEDTHLISAVLAARMSNSPINVYADDSLKIDSVICYARGIGL